MEGEQVKTLQYLLREAGYDVQIDGDFGRSTEQALIKFQRDNKISVDGRAGPRTVEALTS
ncbi:MAG: peptidoglycan-binding protein [Alphaproteobacteria bacterium]|nr:peptidoglycan-binding protein [Alphaproteobacteria bacterium]